MRSLVISDDLTLPRDAATQTFAFIGRKGSGKTYGSGKLVELLVDTGVQVVILDSVGNWYGLRLGADGRSEGLDVAILGGLRGDVPLEATGGALVADVIVESGRSLIIDVSQFSKADRQRFATALGERLWLRRKGEHDPIPLHLVIEESQLIIPEQTNRQKDAARMVGIYEEIIRLGRNYGIGVTMITQRPQSVSKEVLNQTECLMVFQVNGAHERKALKDWIVHQGMDTALLAELPTFKPGNCYVWSPQWLEVLQRIRIAPKRTFDSTGTPRAGTPKRGRRELRAIDLDELKAKMAATIERAKADDPKALRAEIAALKRELAVKPPAPAAEVRMVERPVLTAEQEQAVFAAAGALEEASSQVQAIRQAFEREMPHTVKALGDAQRLLAEVRGTIAAAVAPQRAVNAAPAPRASAAVVPPARPQRQATAAPARRASEGGDALTGPEQRIVDAIAWLASIGVEDPEQPAVAFLAGYTYGGGAFNNPRGALRTKGLVEYIGDRIRLTEAGQAAANEPTAPLESTELHERVLARLPGPEQRLLRPLLAAYPSPMTNDDLAAAAGYTAGAGAYNNPRGRLRSLGLVEYPAPGHVRARDILFLGDR